ncbi:hypothetical protein [Aeromonas sp. QDB66]|nr:hypothetical protein [Aeromonas sp. QDB66]
MKHELIMVDGNEAAARVAYQLSEVCAIYRRCCSNQGTIPQFGDLIS